MLDPRADDALRKALSQLASADAPELLAEARLAARVRARALIEDAIVEELLRAVAGERVADRSPAGGVPRRHAETQPSPAPDPGPQSEEPREGEPAGREPAAAPSADGWWAYCVIDAGEREAAPVGAPGIEPPGPVELVQEGELAALVSPVPLTEFSDERLREHLNDIEWVERVARLHERVLEQTLERATLVPLRLCTLYTDRDGVARMLREQEPVLRQALASLRGRREWGVKLFADPDRLLDAVTERSSPDSAGAASGTAYMQRRQRERELSERAQELGDEIAEEIHARLEQVADAARANAPQRQEVHGRDGRMLLNGVYLVPREREDDFADLVSSLREQRQESGFELELTGPWPPYNFVSTSAMVMP